MRLPPLPGIRIDTRSNRQWSAALAAVKSSGTNIRRAVVLAFGTNAGVDEPELRETLKLLGPDRMIVLVNLHLNMSRTAGDNALLQRVASQNPNVIVADWNSAVTADPSQLQPDGIHPSMTGQHLFAKTIRAALATLSEKHTGQKVTLKDLPINSFCGGRGLLRPLIAFRMPIHNEYLPASPLGVRDLEAILRNAQ